MSSGVIGAFPEDTGAQNSSEVPNEHSKSDNLMSGQNQDEAVETDTAVSGAQYGATGNAAEALKEDIESINAGKVNIRFKPLPSAPILKTQVFKINASQKFEAVVRFLKKKLDCKPTDSVFCYVNSVFAPALDENVGGLWSMRAWAQVRETNCCSGGSTTSKMTDASMVSLLAMTVEARQIEAEIKFALLLRGE